jgi:hypothetical protein
MSEKKGNLEKLIYDFKDTNCEVQIKAKWYRTTAREFRSWSGKRRIDNIEYNGTLYYYGTNKKVTEEVKHEGVVFIGNKDPREDKRPRGFM